jgi:hypothetical protein
MAVAPVHIRDALITTSFSRQISILQKLFEEKSDLITPFLTL